MLNNGRQPLDTAVSRHTGHVSRSRQLKFSERPLFVDYRPYGQRESDIRDIFAPRVHVKQVEQQQLDPGPGAPSRIHQRLSGLGVGIWGPQSARVPARRPCKVRGCHWNASLYTHFWAAHDHYRRCNLLIVGSTVCQHTLSSIIT